MNEKLELRAHAAPWRSGIELLVRQGAAVGVKVEMETLEPGYYVEPTLRIGLAEAQTLMDDLWTAGLRPSEGSGSAGAMLATQKHLEDMRMIAFGKLLNTTKGRP